MSNKKNSGTRNFFKVGTGLAVGAVAGFVAGILLAPKSGENTREELLETSLRLKDDASGYVDTVVHKGETLLKKSSKAIKIGKDDTTRKIAETVKKVEDSTPVEQVIAKVQHANADTQAAVHKAEEQIVDKVEDSTDSLLARIQNITAENIDE